MTWRPDGFETDDYWQGFKSVASGNDIEKALETLPVLNSPIFHAHLRHCAIRESLAGTAAAGFTAGYSKLFRLLHEQAHERALKAAVEHHPLVASSSSRNAPRLSVSPYFEMLRTLPPDAVPQPPVTPLDPATTGALISVELARLGVQLILPSYEPIPGVRQSAIVVECPRCHLHRVVVRVHFIDLIARPELRDVVAMEGFNQDLCQGCGLGPSKPKFLWICEGPPAADPLGALGTIVQIKKHLRAYCPPEGMPHTPELERVVEIRFEGLEKQWSTPLPHPTSQEEGATAIVVAYNSHQLGHFVRNWPGQGAMPAAMRALIEDYERKLVYRQASPAQLQASLREGPLEPFFREWPVFLASDLLPNRPHLAVAHYTVTEACAQRSGVEAVMQAGVAMELARALLALGELALAEGALARAEDVTNTLPAGESQRALSTQLRILQSEILTKTDDHSASVSMARSLLSSVAGASLADRASHHQLAAYAALGLFRSHRYDEAFDAFNNEVKALEMCLEEARGSQDPAAAGLATLISVSLNGALANWGTLLFELADFVSARSQAQAGDTLQPEEKRVRQNQPLSRKRPAKAGKDQPRPLSPEQAAQIDSLNAAVRRFSAHFHPTDRQHEQPEPDTIRDVARALVLRALAMSEAVENWRHAGRQALRLVEQASPTEDPVAVELWMQKALDYASRVDDHDSLAIIHDHFARYALKNGDGALALASVRAAARETIQNIVGRGHHDTRRSAEHIISSRALECVAAGADKFDSIIVVESLKAVSLSVSMMGGVDFLAHQESTSTVERVRGLRNAQERLRQRAKADPTQVAGLEGKLAELAAAIKRVQADAYVRDSRYGQWCDAAVLDLTDTTGFLRNLASVGPEATYIGFFARRDRIFSYAAWSGGVLLDERPWPKVSDSAVMKGGATTKNPRLDTRKLEMWAQALLEPLAPRLQTLGAGAQVIVSVPPLLSILPLAALPFQGRPFCELARISHVQGFGVLEACRHRRTKPPESVFCVGNPYRLGAKSLRLAEKEVHRIARLFQQAGLRAVTATQRHAHIRGLCENSANSDVLHFACHAGPESQDHPYPFLVLSPEGEDSGDLTADRVLRELELKEGCHVNLSACISVTQGDAKGPAANGLVPAFLMKGVGSVLATLWSVFDKHAAIFSVEFYQRILQGSSAVVSLAELQRACIRGELGPEMQQPEVWAGYTLFGLG